MKLNLSPKIQVFKRANLKGLVLIHDEQKLFIAPISNISAGGVFIRELLAIKPGRKVRLVVKSEQLRSPIQAEGRVVRIEKDKRKGLAVEFTELNATAREAIQKLVAEKDMEKAIQVA